MSSTSLDKHSDEKQEVVDVSVVEVSAADVDTGAMLASGVDDLDPAEAVRIRKKIDRHILPLMCGMFNGLSPDKTTLGNAAVLGIEQGAHLTVDQSRLGTIFYISYLAFEFPQNVALQRFPVARWIRHFISSSINVFIWAIVVCSHAACKSFTSLMVVRFILGVCEGFLIITAMFYTRKEQTVRVGYWSATAQIISGFLSFGILHMKPGRLASWQWLMIITGLMTFVIAVCFWFLFPDSPTTAWFLTPEERVMAVLRIKKNQTGVENKQFKKEQFIEALRDPKTWLFALYAIFTQIPNRNQKPLIVNSFGFTVIQTTLLTCVDGVISIATVAIGVNVAAWSEQRAYTAFAWKTVDVLGAVLVITLPWSNKIGLLFSLWVAGIGSTAFVIVIAWLGSVTAGHTKRITTNTIMLIAYCVGNAIGPTLTLPQAKYKPRNRVPWSVCIMTFVVCLTLILIIRWYLAAENRRRDREPPSHDYDNVCVDYVSSDGKLEKVKIDKEFLDLTDIQNRDFRYVL
ncbi:MFS general substrate transporter [Mycena galopus ATCC 62051]|nr:MFS general substrate transporter [Mycena galopus ATCC 62051]